jgi:glycosyltransferase involved in cell wall biosynthesis
MMKILHVIPSVAPVRGGPSHAILAMVKALREQGVDAEIATTNDNGINLLDVPLQQRIEYQQVPVWFFPRFSPKVEPIREFVFSSQLTSWLWQNVCEYDLLHIHAVFSYSSTVAMVIARIKGIPYIIRPGGHLCEWSLQQSSHKKQIYLTLIGRAALNHSQGFHFTTEQEQKEASKLSFQSPSFILPHGLSIPASIPDARHRLRQLLKVPEDEPVILFLSRLHPKKGLDYLIPAMGKLTHQRFTFVLAGGGSPEYEAKINALLVSAGLQERTYCSGFVTGEMKNLLLQGADMFALTSHSENFGVAVLEAMAVGLPVVITPNVALASVIEKHQVGYVPQQDVDAISATIAHCLAHPQQAKQKGAQARKLILEEYTWDQITKKIIRAYATIINQQIM